MYCICSVFISRGSNFFLKICYLTYCTCISFCNTSSLENCCWLKEANSISTVFLGYLNIMVLWTPRSSFEENYPVSPLIWLNKSFKFICDFLAQWVLYLWRNLWGLCGYSMLLYVDSTFASNACRSQTTFVGKPPQSPSQGFIFWGIVGQSINWQLLVTLLSSHSWRSSVRLTRLMVTQPNLNKKKLPDGPVSNNASAFPMSECSS